MRIYTLKTWALECLSLANNDWQAFTYFNSSIFLLDNLNKEDASIILI